MINFVSTRPAVVCQRAGILLEDYHRYYGMLISPVSKKSIAECVGIGGRFVVDNGAFVGFDEAAFYKLLDKVTPYQHLCEWVVCPDVIQDAHGTAALFDIWEPRLRERGFKVALVAQCGQESVPVQWDRIDALFIGGCNTFKASGYVRSLIAEAQARGKWVHAGRVNTKTRLRYVDSLGVDSFDGTGFSAFPPMLANFHQMMTSKQLTLGGIEC